MLRRVPKPPVPRHLEARLLSGIPVRRQVSRRWGRQTAALVAAAAVVLAVGGAAVFKLRPHDGSAPAGTISHARSFAAGAYPGEPAAALAATRATTRTSVAPEPRYSETRTWDILPPLPSAL